MSASVFSVSHLDSLTYSAVKLEQSQIARLIADGRANGGLSLGAFALRLKDIIEKDRPDISKLWRKVFEFKSELGEQIKDLHAELHAYQDIIADKINVLELQAENAKTPEEQQAYQQKAVYLHNQQAILNKQHDELVEIESNRSQARSMDELKDIQRNLVDFQKGFDLFKTGLRKVTDYLGTSFMTAAGALRSRLPRRQQYHPQISKPYERGFRPYNADNDNGIKSVSNLDTSEPDKPEPAQA